MGILYSENADSEVSLASSGIQVLYKFDFVDAYSHSLTRGCKVSVTPPMYCVGRWPAVILCFCVWRRLVNAVSDVICDGYANEECNMEARRKQGFWEL